MQYNTSSIGIVASILIIILSGFLIVTYSPLNYTSSTNYFIRFLQTKSLSINIRNNHINLRLVLPVPKLLVNLTYSINRIYHHDGIAYDYYSKDDLGQSSAGYQWKNWPLPNEAYQTSPFVISKLPFVDTIYVMSVPRLTQRHANLKLALLQQGIPIESIQWRMKWNQTTCNSDQSHSYVYQRLNLKDKPLNDGAQRTCAIMIEHTDVWYEIAERKVPLGLILEDDAIFVPFFKEKFTRMIYAAIQTGILRLNGTCAKSKNKPISYDERINQNPMIVIGGCEERHDYRFQKQFSNATPILPTHKSNSRRCSHAYLLTSCSAQALVDQIQAQKTTFRVVDLRQDYLIRLSPTLQSFWMDPPLCYQGSKVIDLDNLDTFKKTTYK